VHFSDRMMMIMGLDEADMLLYIIILTMPPHVLDEPSVIMCDERIIIFLLRQVLCTRKV